MNGWYWNRGSGLCSVYQPPLGRPLYIAALSAFVCVSQSIARRHTLSTFVSQVASFTDALSPDELSLRLKWDQIPHGPLVDIHNVAPREENPVPS